MRKEYLLQLDKQYYSMSELRSLGLTHYKIGKMVESGILIKLNNKTYENIKYDGEESDFATVCAYAPRGVICMMSAARFYNLTTYLPEGVDVAIGRDMKISTFPDWPQINTWFFPDRRYSVGKTEETDNACTFPIYDIEKTVIDILYYRNKIGIEETKEVLKKYLAREDRDLVKLHRYADSLGCKKILGTYMEVLL